MRTHARLWLFTLIGVVLLSACTGRAARESATARATVVAPVEADTLVVAEGRLVPRRTARLAFLTGGSVSLVNVPEGQQAQEGEVLIQLDDRRQRAAVEGAEAAVSAARSGLARLEEGARPVEVGPYQAGVELAQGNLQVARAQEESAAKAVALAAEQVTKAQAALDDLLAGPTEQELEIVRRGVDVARNELWRAQAARDGVGGGVARGLASQSDLDQAEAAVSTAEAALAIAEADLARVEAGARPDTVAGARAGLRMAEADRERTEALYAAAEGQVAVAEASVRKAQAQMDLVAADPSHIDLDLAHAGVRQAEASLQAARASLDETILMAPFSGTVVAVDIEVGEQVGPGIPLVQLADLSSWQVETDDLTEIEVVQIAVGQEVSIVADALPDVTLTGVVDSVRQVAEMRRGETTYTVAILMDEVDPRLLWGMTVIVTFER